MKSNARLNAKQSVRFAREQSGYALLLVVVGLVIGSLAYLTRSLNATEIRQSRDEITRQALAQAKEALIGWSLTASQGPGHLPCPDFDNDGGSQGAACGAIPSTRIGRLPWRTLGLSRDLKDGDGENLWYAVSSDFTNHSGNPVNSDTQGQLTVLTTPASPVGAAAVPVSNNVIAIVFSAGSALTGQTRGGAEMGLGIPKTTPSNYLEGANADMDAGDQFELPAKDNINSNDQLALIRSEDLFPVVTNEVARRLKTEISPMLNYYRDHWKSTGASGFYPYPSLFLGANLQLPPAASDCGMPMLTQGFVPPSNGCISWAETTAMINSTACVSVPIIGALQNAARCTITSTGAPLEVGTGLIKGAALSLVVLEPSIRINGLSVPWNPESSTTNVTSFSDISVAYTLHSVPVGDTVEVTLPLYAVQQRMLDVNSVDTTWFFENAWYRHTLYAASIRNLPDANTGGCVAGASCLTALGTGGVENNKEALLILAGPVLPAVPLVKSPRTGAIIEYFEDQNVDGNALEFKSAPRTKLFNDKLVLVSPQSNP